MLSKNQIKHLRKLAHNLNPVVMVGQHGLSEALFNELEIALAHHELVKVKLAAGDREDRVEMIRQLCETSGAETVQSIGKTVTLFRRNRKKPVIDLPRAN